MKLTQTFMDFTAKMLADPNRLLQAQMELWAQYMKLWQVTTQRLMGQTVEPVAEPAKGDKRFADPAWKDEVVFDYLKQSYLLTARWFQGTVKEVEGIDDKTAKKVEFYTRQFIDAMSPSNFAMTNPQVVKATMETKGENLIKGLQNLLTDLERGKGKLAIRQTDMKAFKVGGNVATSPGKVVFQNELIKLSSTRRRPRRSTRLHSSSCRRGSTSSTSSTSSRRTRSSSGQPNTATRCS